MYLIYSFWKSITIKTCSICFKFQKWFTGLSFTTKCQLYLSTKFFHNYLKYVFNSFSISFTFRSVTQYITLYYLRLNLQNSTKIVQKCQNLTNLLCFCLSLKSKVLHNINFAIGIYIERFVVFISI